MPSEFPTFVRYKEVTTLDGTESIYLDDANSDVPKKILYTTLINVSTDNYIEKSSTYTIVTTDKIVNCTSGTFTITLPTAVGVGGKTYSITNSGGGIITLDADGTETIQGDLTQFIYSDETIDIVSNGANWFVI